MHQGLEYPDLLLVTINEQYDLRKISLFVLEVATAALNK